MDWMGNGWTTVDLNLHSICSSINIFNTPIALFLNLNPSKSEKSSVLFLNTVKTLIRVNVWDFFLFFNVKEDGLEMRMIKGCEVFHIELHIRDPLCVNLP